MLPIVDVNNSVDFSKSIFSQREIYFIHKTFSMQNVLFLQFIEKNKMLTCEVSFSKLAKSHTVFVIGLIRL